MSFLGIACIYDYDRHSMFNVSILGFYIAFVQYSNQNNTCHSTATPGSGEPEKGGKDRRPHVSSAGCRVGRV
jgi:hypothetical protein